MAIFKRGRTYWYHFIFNGQHIQESTKQGNPRLARQLEAAHRTALAKGEAFGKGKKPVPSLRDFCERRIEPWARATFEQASPKSWFWYRTGLRSIYAYAPLATMKLDAITTETIADFAAHLQGKGLQVSSTNSALRVLRRSLRLAVEWGVLPSSPKVKMLRGERHRDFVLSREEEVCYLAACPEPLCSIATVLAGSGMRVEEALRMQWEYVALVNGRHGSIFVPFGKSVAARRTVPLTPRVREILGHQWEQAGKPQEGWVWPAPTASGHAEPSTLRKQHRRALRDSKVRRFVLHSLRHTFLTRLGEAGVNVWVLAKLAGHASLQMSARYVHASEDSVLNALSRLQEPPQQPQLLPQNPTTLAQ